MRAGERLADEFMPSEATRDKIRSRYPDLDLSAEIDKFIGYWTENDTERAIKKNWNLAFINWCHNAIKFSGNSSRAESTVERRNKIVGGAIYGAGNNPFDEIT